MPESSLVVRPQPMGSGSVTASTRLQAAGLPKAIELFEQAAGAVPLPSSAQQPVVIADYGAGNGHNSLLPICSAITVLRKRLRHDHSILVSHTDVPDNDFTALFRTLTDDPDSYLRKDSATFFAAVGRSYYSQILPSNSVNLGWSSWGVQWLGKVPMPVTDHVQVSYSADSAVRAAYAKQAAFDWHEFVAFRGRELCPGGRLVVLTMGLGEDGHFACGAALAAVADTLRELTGDGLITADESARMSLPVVGRREADFHTPFAPSGRFEGLSVEHAEVFNAEDRFWSQYRVDKDAKGFGARWAGFARDAVFPMLAAGLAGGQSDPRVGDFYDRLERGIADRLAAAPEQMPLPLARVVLTKHRAKR
jgi:salicylate 1-O-methyltransferase